MVCGNHWGKYLKIKAEPLNGSPLLAEILGTIVKISLFSPQICWIKTPSVENQSSNRCHIYQYHQGQGGLFEVMYTKSKLNAPPKMKSDYILISQCPYLFITTSGHIEPHASNSFYFPSPSFRQLKKKKDILRELSFRESSKVTQWFPFC